MTEPLSADQIEDLRQTLVDRLAGLEGLDAPSDDDRKPVELDQQSVGRIARVDVLQRQAMAFASQARRHQEARKMTAALQRIAEGEFGWCGGCGEPIPLARLRLDATIPTCIDCAF